MFPDADTRFSLSPVLLVRANQVFFAASVRHPLKTWNPLLL